MKTTTSIQNVILSAAIAMGFSFTNLPSRADEPAKTLDAPGFRPASEHAERFRQEVENAKIGVLPTIVRTIEKNHILADSPDSIAKKLREYGIQNPIAINESLEVGTPEGRAQWELFQSDLSKIRGLIQPLSDKADYFFVLEFLVTRIPSGGQAVGGIHCFILDPQGRNAFSFLLNSHHTMFEEAGLVEPSTSEDGLKKLADESTAVALRAFRRQIHSAQ
jgi:hypothetical protein